MGYLGSWEGSNSELSAMYEVVYSYAKVISPIASAEGRWDGIAEKKLFSRQVQYIG